ncbi:hypothetical protein PGT21_027716 [Puccinia graminis f. sp. tritici]|uniref:Uncharacterized protein n=1 Tax=Puccinia graminis f. sp. tritici TaxID=56615 RepID=A0A5B0PJ63_PUCGR|nr:hypothetical protein PGT21_027716 [Puccinia graminis f. sp. tritici]
MPIYSLPSLRQPESISPQFYFTSQSFINRAQSDIDHLLTTWQDSVKALPTHHNKQQQHYYHHHTTNNINNNQHKRLGPFLKFKSIYSRLGWIYIHLSVVDPALRKDWFNTLTRLFLNNLNQQSDTLRQIGSLFGLWALWGTQPPESVLGPKQFIIIDPETSDYLDRLPSSVSEELNRYFKDSVDESFEQQQSQQQQQQQPKQHSHHHPQHPSSSSALSTKHRAHLDPNIFGPPPPTIKPADSVHQVLKNLRDQEAFLIQPVQTALVYPPLPTNRVTVEKSLIDLLDPDSIDHHHTTTNNNKASDQSSPARVAEIIRSTHLQLHTLANTQPNALCDPIHLNHLRSSYLNSKSFLTHNPPEQSSSSSSSPSTPSLDPLTRELFADAIGMTRKVIQKTGPGLDHLLFPNNNNNNNNPRATTTSNTKKNNPDLNGSKKTHNQCGSRNQDGVDRQVQEEDGKHELDSLDAFFLVDRAQSIPQLETLLKNHPHKNLPTGSS